MTIDRILQRFPLAWRARYESEVRELLEASPFGWRERRDLMRACADAWWREGCSWAAALAKLTLALAVRLGVMITLGWWVASTADSLALTPGVAVMVGSWGPVWSVILRSAQLVLWLAVLFVIRPYLDSGAEQYRPSWFQWGIWCTGSFLLCMLDGRSAQLGDVMCLGLLVMMRHSRWLVVVDGWPSPANHTRAVLGLRP